MTQDFSEIDIQEALDLCAAEPVHTPGIVQPFGLLVGVHSDTGRIEYASENCMDVLGIAISDVLGKQARDVFGREVSHALNNAAARADFNNKAVQMGLFEIGNSQVTVQAFASGDVHVMQFECSKQPELGSGDGLSQLAFLMSKIQTCSDQSTLFDLTTDLLRHITGFDRVMIYKFDSEFNGAVVAETRSRALEPFIGLNFPHWDIPEQARAIMKKIPLRLIQDVAQTAIPLRGLEASLPPLDITLAECRGVSPIHMQYLRNMNVEATLTLSIVVEDALWGIISFHHRRPHIPSPETRKLLTAFLDVFVTKLTALIKDAQLVLVRKTDSFKDSVLDEIENEEAFEQSVSRFWTVIEDVLQADGMAFLIASKTVSHGLVPEQAVLEHLLDETQKQLGKPIVSNSLAQDYPQFQASLNGCAGVIASAISEHRALCIFRKEAARSVSWAGNPKKIIEHTSGASRLEPRASFSKYLEEIKDFSVPWTDEDLYFAEWVWVLIDSAESRVLKNTLNRQQTLMINELNHRVRNILALVRSVSRQARQHYGSLESYSASLENRVQALAAAHDMATGSDVSSVDVQQLIDVELAPYREGGSVHIAGPNRQLRADIAPIFSLVIHELATNAVKYGALSKSGGSVSVTMEDTQNGYAIHWREYGGPAVIPPKERGFGSILIEQAVPHEMGGSAELRFEPGGVESDLFLPNVILDSSQLPTLEPKPKLHKDAPERISYTFDPTAFSGFVLLLEDNFVIATDMKDQLSGSGISEIELCSNAVDALDAINAEVPTFAILDVNLGPNLSSEAVARVLDQKGVPFVFVTGYGDQADLPAELTHIRCLTKPVATKELQEAMMAALHR